MSHHFTDIAIICFGQHLVSKVRENKLEELMATAKHSLILT